jgi:hypothetical protein
MLIRKFLPFLLWGIPALALAAGSTSAQKIVSLPTSGTGTTLVDGTTGTLTFNIAGSGSNGYVLTTNGSGQATFQPVASSGGTVTSIVIGSGLTGNPSTITTTGTVSLNLASANVWIGTQAGTWNGIFVGQGSGTFTGQSSGTFTGQGSGTFTGQGTGTFTGLHIGAVTGTATNALAVPVSGLTGAGTGVVAALGNPTASTGAQVLTSSQDVFGNATLTPSGISTSINLFPENSVIAPAVVYPSGLGFRLIGYGDSLTAGVGGTQASSILPYAGSQGCWPDFFGVSPEGLATQIWNLGISGQTTYSGLTQYNAGSGTTTCTTAGSTSVTITGSTSGMSGTMAVASSTGDIPVNTTATISGTTLTLSQAATGSHSGQTLYFCTSTTYGWSSSNLHTNAHILSESVTGLSTWFVNAYGTNNYYLGCMTCSGTATNGSGTITGVSINTGISVSGASLATAVTGTYEAFGGAGTGNGANFTDLGTIVSQSGGTSFVVSNPSAVTASMVTFKIETNPNNAASDSGGTSWWSNWQALNSLALADGDQVIACTMFPFVASSSAYAQGQYDENRLVFNALIRAKYSNGGVSGVTLCDLANIPQLSYLINGSANPAYQTFRNQTTANPHLNDTGYQVEANAIQAGITQASSSSVTIPMNPFSLYGISKYWLPADIPYLDAANNAFTGSMQVFGFTMGATGSGTALATMQGNSQYVSGGFGDAWTLSLNNSWTTYGNWTMHGPIGEVVFTDKKNSIDELTLTPGTPANGGGAGTPDLRISAAQTAVAASGSGTATFSEPFQGTSYKSVLVHFAAVTGTASYVFPTPFTVAPTEVDSLGLATTIGTGTVTVTGASSTTNILLIGY